MDSYPLEFPSRTPTHQLLVADNDLLSFEETFDPRSLKEFFRKQSIPSSVKIPQQLKQLGLEEGVGSQTFDALSPATTVHSHSLTESFSLTYEDLKFDGTFGNDCPSQSFGNSLGQVMSPGRVKQVKVVPAKGLRLDFSNQQRPVKDVKETNVQANSQESEMIAQLCAQMKQYYDGTPGNQQPIIELRKNMGTVDLKSREEERVNSGVIRKIIAKKKVFLIIREKPNFKGVQVQRKSSVVSQDSGRSRKKSSITAEESMPKKRGRKASSHPQQNVATTGEREVNNNNGMGFGMDWNFDQMWFS